MNVLLASYTLVAAVTAMDLSDILPVSLLQASIFPGNFGLTKTLVLENG